MHTESPSAPQGAAPQGRERRRHPRATAEWPVQLALKEGLFEARLRDVSSSGLCFFLDRRIPEMTVLGLEFELPGSDGATRVACRGAVVRCEPISPQLDHFEIAVFLHEIADDARVAIGLFVDQGD